MLADAGLFAGLEPNLSPEAVREALQGAKEKVALARQKDSESAAAPKLACGGACGARH
jgi:hypothetical protein